MDSIHDIDGDQADPAVKTYLATIEGIQKFGQQADKALDRLTKAEENWCGATMVKMFA